MREEFLYPKKMYDFPNGGYCGVVVPEHVMKKLVELNYAYSNEVKKILNEYKDELFVSDWTLANEKDGEVIKRQEIIKFASPEDSWDNIEDRINKFQYVKPEYLKEFYVVKDRETAENIAKEILKEKIEEDKEDMI